MACGILPIFKCLTKTCVFVRSLELVLKPKEGKKDISKYITTWFEEIIFFRDRRKRQMSQPS